MVGGCKRLFRGDISSLLFSMSFGGAEPMSSSLSTSTCHLVTPRSVVGPFSGLTICVTGLSKEARKQVKDATERLGGHYSPNLHPQCTHLVVQSLNGHKFEHALKHGFRNGLFLVTLGWFVDSIRRNVRLSESLYSVKTADENTMPTDDLKRLSKIVGSETSCLPASLNVKTNNFDKAFPLLEKAPKRSGLSSFSGFSFYIDSDNSPELQRKVVEAAAAEGAQFVDHWFVGCSATHVVCEGSSIRKYIGHSSTLVTPLWVLKAANEKCIQRLVHMSADMARQVEIMLDNAQYGVNREDINGRNQLQDAPSSCSKISHKKRENIIKVAKNGVRKRRRHRMQTCQTPIHPITPSILLDSVCWSVSEPASSASIYTDSFRVENACEYQTSVFYDAKGDGNESESSFVNSRAMTESEKNEVVFKNHILTILFPVDRFSEMGPCSRTFFSDKGFTCLKVLDHIYKFYQENMSDQEVEVAIHTDSRHADRLRAVYSSKESAEQGYLTFKRIDLLGSRKSFEMLKRVNGDNTGNVYELLIRA